MYKDDAEVAIIPLSQITFGDRRRTDYGNLHDLSQSIKENGLITSLTVKRLGDDTYLLLGGGRRYKACEMLEIEKVPVRIYNRDLNDLEIRSIELAENMDRKELTWQEKVRLEKEIHDLQIAIHGEAASGPGPGWSQSDTAALMGLSRPKVQQDVKLAVALEAFPELAGCKTRDEAMKRLGILSKAVEREVISEKLLKKAALTPSDRIKADLCNSYVIGDFFEKIKHIPDESVDFVEIDTPYAIDLKDKKASADGEAMQTDNYNEWPMDQYPYLIGEVLNEAYRVLRREGWIVFWLAPDPWFSVAYNAITRAGFQCRATPGIWLKGADEESEGSGQTMNPGMYMANAYEMFFYARKGQAQLNMMGRSNVFAYKPVFAKSKIHPTERPIEMIMEMCNVFCPMGGTVLTPFAGSGNTILAAHNTIRSCFGYDLTSECKDSFIIRVFEGAPHKYRSYKETVL